jgi:DNA-directed RNA polymerase subunit K/omega
MEYKKSTPESTVTRDLIKMAEETGNIYETVRIIGKRSNQISAEIKHELGQKLQEFSSATDTLEEVFENHEQIETSRFFEKMPKSTLIATQEFIGNKLSYRNPAKEKESIEFDY